MAGNQVNGPQDLENNATRIAGPGHSYDYLSYSLYDAQGKPLVHPLPKNRSMIDRNAEKEWVLMDAMELGIPNTPDTMDNHRTLGGNVLFVDGHVQWVNSVDWHSAFVRGNSLR
jgi:prepilin-type processing-associated H-X9-DG protein